MAVRDVKVRLGDKELAELAVVRATLQGVETERAVTDAEVLRVCLADMALRSGKGAK